MSDEQTTQTRIKFTRKGESKTITCGSEHPETNQFQASRDFLEGVLGVIPKLNVEVEIITTLAGDTLTPPFRFKIIETDGEQTFICELTP